MGRTRSKAVNWETIKESDIEAAMADKLNIEAGEASKIRERITKISNGPLRERLASILLNRTKART